MRSLVTLCVFAVITASASSGSIDQVKMAAVSPATDFSFDFQDLLLVPQSPR